MDDRDILTEVLTFHGHRCWASMAAAIADCQMLLARGMGMGAYESLGQAGIRSVITTIANIEDAALQAANGTIVDHQERLH